jgi:HK97 family phage major capsid protein
MAILSVVLEKPLGEQAEGTVIQCDEAVAAALVSAGVAREATEEDVVGGEDEGAEPEAETDEAETEQEAVRQLAANAKQTMTKAVEHVAEKLARASVKRPLGVPGNRHVTGSDLHLTGGFKNVGEAAMAYIAKSKGDYDAARKYSHYTKALDARFKATGMSVAGGSGHQGGDLVPQQWADELWRLSFQHVPDLLGMMTKYEMRNQVENIPAWVQASASSGITASVIGEATDITATVGTTATVQLSLVKGAALVNASDELLRFNSYNLETVIRQVVPERIRFLTNGGVVAGTNSQLNLLNCPGAVTVIAEAPGRISFNDVTKMDAALYDDFDDAIWLTSKSSLPELYNIPFPTRAATYQTPAFTPGGFGDLLGPKPKGTLLGRPIYTLENVPALGSRGALILWHPKSCAAGYSGLIADQTPYLYFNLAQNTFRFLFYYDSINPLTAPYVRADGTSASNVVVLSAGSTSSS